MEVQAALVSKACLVGLPALSLSHWGKLPNELHGCNRLRLIGPDVNVGMPDVLIWAH